VTLKLLNQKLIIARILFGGLIYRQGLLQVGDRIVEVNNEPVDSMSPSELQDMLVGVVSFVFLDAWLLHIQSYVCYSAHRILSTMWFKFFIANSK